MYWIYIGLMQFCNLYMYIYRTRSIAYMLNRTYPCIYTPSLPQEWEMTDHTCMYIFCLWIFTKIFSWPPPFSPKKDLCTVNCNVSTCKKHWLTIHSTYICRSSIWFLLWPGWQICRFSQLNIHIYHNHALGLPGRCPGVHGEDFKKDSRPVCTVFIQIYGLWVE